MTYRNRYRASGANLTAALAAYLPLAGGTMTGAIDAGGFDLANLPAPATANSAARKAYVDAADTAAIAAAATAAAGLYLPLAGGTLTGALTVGVDDGNNASVVDVITARHTTSGAAAPGIGAAVLFQSEDASNNVENIARIGGSLTNTTGGSEASQLSWELRTAGGALAEAARLTPVGLCLGTSLQNPAATVGLLVCMTASNVGVIQITNANSGLTASDGLTMSYSGASGSGVGRLSLRETGTLIFGTSGTDRWQFNSNGDLEALGPKYIEMREMTAPAAPSADRGRLYMEDSGGGKTRLMVIFPSGAAQQIAIEP